MRKFKLLQALPDHAVGTIFTERNAPDDWRVNDHVAEDALCKLLMDWHTKSEWFEEVKPTRILTINWYNDETDTTTVCLQRVYPDGTHPEDLIKRIHDAISPSKGAAECVGYNITDEPINLDDIPF